GLLCEQMAKRLGLLQELVPKAPLIGVLVNPSYSGFDLQLQQLQEAAGTLRQELHVEKAHTEHEIGAAFEALIQRRASAILVAHDPFFFNRTTQSSYWRHAMRSPRYTIDVSSPQPAGS